MDPARLPRKVGTDVDEIKAGVRRSGERGCCGLRCVRIVVGRIQPENEPVYRRGRALPVVVRERVIGYDVPRILKRAGPGDVIEPVPRRAARPDRKYAAVDRYPNADDDAVGGIRTLTRGRVSHREAVCGTRC